MRKARTVAMFEEAEMRQKAVYDEKPVYSS
jgi:hypothetical protein